MATTESLVYRSDESQKIDYESMMQLHRDPIHLSDEDIHIWKVPLKFDKLDDKDLQRHLSKEEEEKSNKFLFRKDRKHYILTHGLLRIILARYLDQEPYQIHYTYSIYGKPGLKNNQDDRMLSFNMSHSAGTAIYAVTRNRNIGIDIERIVKDFPCEEIAERFFSPREYNELLKVKAGFLRERAFFSCWTRKEAYIKARGVGFSMPLDEFDVSVSQNMPVQLIVDREDRNEKSQWTLMNINSAPGYVSALAVEGFDFRVSYFELA